MNREIESIFQGIQEFEIGGEFYRVEEGTQLASGKTSYKLYKLENGDLGMQAYHFKGAVFSRKMDVKTLEEILNDDVN